MFYTARDPIMGWEALSSPKREFPLTPDEARSCLTPELRRIASSVSALFAEADEALQREDLGEYWLAMDTADILLDHLRAAICREYVERNMTTQYLITKRYRNRKMNKRYTNSTSKTRQTIRGLYVKLGELLAKLNDDAALQIINHAVTEAITAITWRNHDTNTKTQK